MATIYSLVTDSDSGTSCHLFTNEAARDAWCFSLCAEDWDAKDGPMPADWRAAWETISETADWWLVVEDHDMPELQLAALVAA